MCRNKDWVSGREEHRVNGSDQRIVIGNEPDPSPVTWFGARNQDERVEPVPFHFSAQYLVPSPCDGLVHHCALSELIAVDIGKRVKGVLGQTPSSFLRSRNHTPHSFQVEYSPR